MTVQNSVVVEVTVTTEPKLGVVVYDLCTRETRLVLRRRGNGTERRRYGNGSVKRDGPYREQEYVLKGYEGAG